MSRLRSIASATAANAVRGLAPAALSAGLPICLVALLPKEDFATWSLGVTLAGYVVVFQAGVQQAVTAATGRTAKRPAPAPALALAAALQFLAPLLLLATGLATVVAIFATDLFPAVPARLLWQFRIGFLLLFLAAMSFLVSSVVWGYAIGLQRLRVVLALSMLARLGAFAIAVVVAALTDNLILIALGYTVPALACLPMQLRSVGLSRRSFARRSHGALRRFRRSYAAAVRTLATWSIGMLLVTGLDGTIVGRFDFGHTGLYLLVASIVTVLITACGSWQAPFLAWAPGLGRGAAIRDVSRIAMTVNLLLACLFALPMRLLLDRLFQSHDAKLGFAIFVILTYANVLRQFAVPAILSAVAAERFHRLVLPSVAEGAVNLVLSVGLCAAFGALGVAYGTLAGALLAVGMVLGYTFGHSAFDAIDRRQFARAALTRPVGALLVPIGASTVAAIVLPAGILSYAAQALFALLAIGVGWLACLEGSEREMIRRVPMRLRRPVRA